MENFSKESETQVAKILSKTAANLNEILYQRTFCYIIVFSSLNAVGGVFTWVQCGFEDLAKEKLKQVFEYIREFSRESFDHGEAFPVKTGRYLKNV